MEETKDEFLPGFQNPDEFSQKACKSMVAASRAFQTLPPAGSPIWDLRKSYPEFNRGLKANRNRLISAMVNLLKHANLAPDDFRRRDVDEKFEFIVDSNDEILERIATSLDKAEGLFQRAEILVVNSGSNVAATPVKTRKIHERSFNKSSPESAGNTPASNSVRKIKKAFYRSKVKEKPQLKFSTPVDNSLTPFVPKLQYKPHSVKPLSILPEYTIDNEEFYGHPYTVELTRWEPKPFMLEQASPEFPKSLGETPFVLVETRDQMKSMLEDLGQAKEIAVDVEHHSYRSFLGLTCLIQISTRNSDYVIDTLALRDEIHNLNDIFANPNILKVFHSATMDITWLQKDFSVYVVGMFDTATAAQALKYASTSLQYLLNQLCEVTTDKSFQLADWRIRPLSDEMLEYARKDTHYLLHIYDLLKNKLIEEGKQFACNLLYDVYDQSRQTCLKRYEKPTNNPQVALRKCKRPLNNRQLHGFIELFKWRDEIARQKDESLGYVLPNHMLLTISETLPKEMTGILACCDPVPVLLSQNLSVIHQIITEARDLPMHFQETSMHHKSEKNARQKNWIIMMDSIHEVDLKENETSSESVLTRNDNEWWKSIDYTDVKVSQTPKVLFDGGMASSKSCSTRDSPQNKFSPFHRYKLTTEIIRNLKDPKKKTQVDLENPLVKSVAITILAEPNDEKEVAVPEPPKPSRKSTILNQEFVPFNPMAVKHLKNPKKRKHAALDEEIREEEDIKQENNGTTISSEEEPEPVEAQQESTQQKKSKKQKKNFLKRLATRGRRRKYELESARDKGEGEIEDGEIINESENSPSANSKASKNSARLTSYVSLGSSPNKKNKTSFNNREGSNDSRKQNQKVEPFPGQRVVTTASRTQESQKNKGIKVKIESVKESKTPNAPSQVHYFKGFFWSVWAAEVQQEGACIGER
ncbi:unnamed protein product [Allacma fusca]|uniref:Exosome complex component 10 homolog n=1 Tax=Allacma fusca TaxID=39272 RepID=A0A8J2K5B4_9HEXA|nr:unnamed protein product [Allacma fusca]